VQKTTREAIGFMICENGEQKEVLLHVSCLEGVFTGVFLTSFRHKRASKSRNDAATAAILSFGILLFHFSSFTLHRAADVRYTLSSNHNYLPADEVPRYSSLLVKTDYSRSVYLFADLPIAELTVP
jgi:hypothetical protein